MSTQVLVPLPIDRQKHKQKTGTNERRVTSDDRRLYPRSDVLGIFDISRKKAFEIGPILSEMFRLVNR